ncbi:hypothetical protein B0H11DRAFT_1905139 [Mycena galericulata]|nr:hypothetical protein B0H11DRAFT_1905139 [Mycena galericulata]
MAICKEGLVSIWRHELGMPPSDISDWLVINIQDWNRTWLLEDPKEITVTHLPANIDGRQLVLVFAENSEFQVYSKPAPAHPFRIDIQSAFFLDRTYTFDEAAGPIIFTQDGEVLAGAVHDAMCLWDLSQHSTKFLLESLIHEDALGVPIADIAQQNYQPPRKGMLGHQSIAIAQGSSVIVWQAECQPVPVNELNVMGCVKVGVGIGIMISILLNLIE